MVVVGLCFESVTAHEFYYKLAEGNARRIEKDLEGVCC